MKIPQTTRAVNLKAVGVLKVEELPLQSCGEDEVLVKVMRCGICGSDIDRVFTKGTYHFPTVPGHEFSGEVIYDPKDEFTGKRVSVFPLLPCFKCDMCREEKYACCSDYDYYGSRRDGGFSEYLVVKKFNLIELPENVSYDEGAMCEPMAVACHAVKKLGDVNGKNVLITGAGTIGLIAARMIESRGAKKVSFIENDTNKIEFFKSLGFEEYRDGEEADCAIEGTGAGAVLSRVAEIVKPSGTVVLMGNPHSDVNLSAAQYQKILRREINLKGTWNSSYAEKENDWRESLQSIADGKLVIKDLITHHFKLEDMIEAITMMRDRKEFFVKVMIDCDK